MDPTQRRIAWAMLLAIVVYFAVQFSRTDTSVPAALPSQPVPASTPTSPAEPCSLRVTQVFYNADLGFVEAQVTGSAARMAATWAGGAKDVDTAEVCSAGTCRMVVGTGRRDLKVQFDGCSPISLPNP
jgi:hypothetical protein